MIDKSTNRIENIKFDHKGETPGLGANIHDFDFFRNQFIGQSISFEPNTFGLMQEDSLAVKGEYYIDGITGASVTCEGAIEMMNTGFKVYEPYLREE